MATASHESTSGRPQVGQDEEDMADKTSQNDEDNHFLVIPLRDASGKETDNGVKIDLSQLPEAEVVLGVLQSEMADLSIWLKFSIEYCRQNRMKQFEVFMESATGDEIQEFYKNDLLGRLRLLNASAGFCCYMFNVLKKDPKDKSAKAAEYQRKALRLIEKAIEFDTNNTFDDIWFTKGCLELYSKEYESAISSFDHALVLNPDNVLSALGMAKIYFYKAQYKKALEEYRKVFLEHEYVPVYARIGLGLCFYKLSSFKRAQECFERAIELEPTNIEAITSLSVLNLSVAAGYDDLEPNQRTLFPSKRALIEEALTALEMSHRLSTTQPVVLNHLANHFFQKDDKDLDQIRSLAKKAAKLALDNKAVAAESIYILGRNSHLEATNLQERIDKDRAIRSRLDDTTISSKVRSDLESKLLSKSEVKETLKLMQTKYGKAKDSYESSVKEWPAFLLSKFGLAQIKLQEVSFMKIKGSKAQKRFQEIKKLLEDVLQKYPTDRDTLFLYGNILLKLEEKEGALNAWKKVVDYNPDDTETWQLIASTSHVLEKVDIRDDRGQAMEQRITPTKIDQEKALQCYKKVFHILKTLNKQPSMPILNNMGVLKWSLNQLESAEVDLKNALHCLDEALEDIDSKHDLKDKFILNRGKIIPYYNLARVKERLGKINAAEAIYREIRTKFPSFSKASKRLGQLYAERGEYVKAEQFLEEARNKDENNVESLLLLSRSYQNTDNNSAFMTNSDKIQKIAFDNAYHRLSDANLHLKNAQKRILSQVKQARRNNIGRDLEKAMGIYSTLLQQTDRANAYAANGFACCLATQQNFHDALAVLEKVKSYLPNIDDQGNNNCLSKNLYKNLGHLSVVEHNYDRAIIYYENCLKRYVIPSDYNYLVHPNKQSVNYATEIRSCLANAYVLDKKPNTAQKLLQQILKDDPTNVANWYNIAITKVHESSRFLKEKEQRRTIQGFQQAHENLASAKDIFSWVSATKTGNKSSAKKKKALNENDKLYVEEPVTPPGSPVANPFESEVVDSKSVWDTVLERAQQTRDKILEEHKAFLEEANLVDQAGEQPIDTSTDAVELESKDTRALSLRAPKSAHFTKAARAQIAVEECGNLFAVCNKHSTHHTKKVEKAELKQKEVEEEMKKREQEKIVLQEKESMAKLREEEALRRRLHAQALENQAFTSKLVEAEENMKRTEVKRKRKASKKKKTGDDFVVDDDEPIEKGNMSEDDTGSKSGDESSDAEDYSNKKRKRIKIVRKHSVDSLPEDKEVPIIDPVLAQEEENEFALGETDPMDVSNSNLQLIPPAP